MTAPGGAHRRQAVLVTLVATAISLLLVELVFWRMLDGAPHLVSAHAFGYLERDAALGVRHISSRHYQGEMRTSDGQLVYRADYSFDAFGRRVTSTGGPPGSRAILFFGCSYVEGSGVNDAETIPSQVAMRTRQYDVLNYGLGSSGPQQMLVQLQQRDFDREGVAAGAEHIGVYTFLSFHVERAIGSMQVVTTFGRNFPFFDLDGSDHLVNRGTFATGRPLRMLAYRALNKSHVVRYALRHWTDWPMSPSARDLQTTAAIVAESKAVFMRRFPRGRFLVVIYPGTRQAAMRPWLSAQGLEVLDLSGLFDPKAPGLSISIDGHPTPAANAILAQRIVEALGL